MKHFIYALLLVFHFGCHSPTTPDALGSYITKELSKENGVLDIRKFDKVNWNRLYIVSAYQTERNFDQSLLNHEHEIDNTGIAHREDISLVLLFNGEDLVSFSKISAKDIILGGGQKTDLNNKNSPFYKDKAVFYYQTINGNKWLK